MREERGQPLSQQTKNFLNIGEEADRYNDSSSDGYAGTTVTAPVIGEVAYG